MKCSYRIQPDQKIIHTPTNHKGEKFEVVVVCDGEWHWRLPGYDKHGRYIEQKTCVCMCPDFSNRWGEYIKREYGKEGWMHRSLQRRDK